MKTTLNKIRAQGPCYDGWRKLLTYLKKTEADDDTLPITSILDSNGLDDALWCLRAVDGHDREIRLYAVWCARQVRHLITHPRSLAALDVAERHANGEATDAELSASEAAARGAARGSAWDAAWGAAWAAALVAAEDAAWGAAWGAARYAARAAAEAAARGSARYAAWGSTWDAAWAAARYAAWGSTWDAAWAAARGAQSARLREVCAEIEYREKT